jgi:hypothetical protein
VSSRTVTALLWVLIAALAVALSASRRVPSLNALTSLATRHPAGRVALFAGWAWLGWHLFAR